MPKYNLLDKIGSGKFNTVFLTNDSDVVARVPKNYEEYSKEIDILKSCRHENIVKYIGFEKVDGVPHMYMEKCLQNLMEYHSQKKNNTTHNLALETKQIFTGLKYLHDNNIIHRDIKPENILVSRVRDSVILKIADFGLTIRDPENCSSLEQRIGTPLYMAPEIIDSSNYSYKVDVFSAGATFLKICFSYFNSDVKISTFHKFIDQYPCFLEDCSEKWSKVCPGIEKLLMCVLKYSLVYDSDKRYTSTQILEVII